MYIKPMALQCVDVNDNVSSHTVGQQTSSTPAHRRKSGCQV